MDAAQHESARHDFLYRKSHGFANVSCLEIVMANIIEVIENNIHASLPVLALTDYILYTFLSELARSYLHGFCAKGGSLSTTGTIFIGLCLHFGTWKTLAHLEGVSHIALSRPGSFRRFENKTYHMSVSQNSGFSTHIIHFNKGFPL